jgi:medium-chain acyl-[acyl-carrier-protein] hydrolase
MDMKARATIMAIAGYLQEIAGNHADKMGFGYKDMKQSGLLWLLTRVKILVHRYPCWNDELRIDTWVVNAEKYFSRRDFEIYDIAGNIMVSAISGWMLVHAKEKRPQSVDTIKMQFNILPDKLAIGEEIQKIEPTGFSKTIASYKVKYRDIDIVNHVNNIRYYSIIIDSLDDQFLMNHRIKSFEINYLAEALLGDNLQISSATMPDGQTVYETIRASDAKTLSRCLISWEKDKFDLIF